MRTLKVLKRNTFWEKSTGLLGYDKAQPIFFKTRFGIHTFGLRFPIDVLILDKYNGIIKLSENLKPNRLFFWPPRYDNVIELPAGTIKNLKLKIGDRVILEIIR